MSSGPRALPANEVLDECASTNDLARALGEAGYPHGTWISARKQVSGRGRMGRAWSSREGNLFLSLVLRLESKAQWTWVPLAVAAGVARHLVRERFDVRIKWPNDLWLGGAKLGGILCEAVGSREGSFIVAGLGLNCASAPEVPEQLTACLADARPGLRADDVRADVIEAIHESVERLVAEGTASLARDYETMAAFPRGSFICWDAHPEAVRVEGLGESGELQVTDARGERLKLFAEEIRAVRTACGGFPA
jgi:BirA family biotin operon repressor/biotin-[acetyl-CoA-carboxylase] ligase